VTPPQKPTLSPMCLARSLDEISATRLTRLSTSAFCSPASAMAIRAAFVHGEAVHSVAVVRSKGINLWTFTSGV
jgi:hypothetical protein